jgi:hypothetical protein
MVRGFLFPGRTKLAWVSHGNKKHRAAKQPEFLKACCAPQGLMSEANNPWPFATYKKNEIELYLFVKFII